MSAVVRCLEEMKDASFCKRGQNPDNALVLTDPANSWVVDRTEVILQPRSRTARGERSGVKGEPNRAGRYPVHARCR
jgi:hypothetical protein